mmetsp:Transcript_49963/g.140835  ORF Transcript_49963/g.140835 Transcript_49963/m.140835 type:complete len:218 (-) Transcript_49963:255-908(-)
MSSGLMPLLNRISHWKAASPVLARIFFATRLPPVAAAALVFGAASTKTSSLSLLSGQDEPSTSSVMILYVQPPSSTGALPTTLPSLSFSSAGLGCGIDTTFLNSPPFPTRTKTLWTLMSFFPVDAGGFHRSVTQLSSISGSPAFSAIEGRPAGNVGMVDPYFAYSRFSLFAAAWMGIPVQWKPKGNRAFLPRRRLNCVAKIAFVRLKAWPMWSTPFM